MTEPTELMPCPFCGHAGPLDFQDGSTHRWGVAYCAECGASAGETRREYPDVGGWHAKAIAQWNTRTPHPTKAQAIPGVQWQCGPQASGFTAPKADPLQPVVALQEIAGMYADDFTPQADSAQNELISREEWVERAMRVYLIAGDTEDEARECAEYQWGELDMDDIPDPYFTAMEDIEVRGPAPQADSQPAQVEVADAVADSQYLAGVSAGWNAANADNPNEALRKLHESRAGYLKPLHAARAPADSVLEDAARYRWLRDNWFTMAATYLDDGVQFYTGGVRYSGATVEKLDAAIDAARKQGANHD